MGTRLIKTRKSSVWKAGDVMARKNKAVRSRKKQRQTFLPKMKKFAAFLYWLASFILIVLELWDRLAG